MATKIHRDELTQSTSVVEPRPTAVPTRQVTALNEVVARVGRDSRVDSRQYLDETIVPEGGE